MRMRKRNNIKKAVATDALIDTVAVEFEKRYSASMQAALNENKVRQSLPFGEVGGAYINLGYRKNHQLKQKTKRHINKLLELPPVERNHLLNAICAQFGLKAIEQTTLNF